MQKLHHGLLDQSAALATREAGRPAQASTRRSASAAYYALFHFLIEEIGLQVVGAGRGDRALRHALARSFDHGSLRECAERFLAGPRSLPEPLRRCFAGHDATSEDLAFAAKGFIELHKMRHQADYDLGAPITRPEAEQAHWLAAESMSRWERMRASREARVFGLAAISWRGLRGR